MNDLGIVLAVAQWVATIGLPLLAAAWYRQSNKTHDLAQRVAVLESMELGKIQPMLTDIRIIVGELKVRLDYQAQGVQPTNQHRRAGDQ